MSSTAAAVVTQQLTAGDSQAAGEPKRADLENPDAKISNIERFDEVYKGRRIAWGADAATSATFGITSTTQGSAVPPVFIDGAALHVMANADGTYSSIINHYQSFPTLRAVARAAVDGLGGATLIPMHHHG